MGGQGVLRREKIGSRGGKHGSQQERGTMKAEISVQKIVWSRATISYCTTCPYVSPNQVYTVAGIGKDFGDSWQEEERVVLDCTWIHLGH
jgi:hypothetical protein